MDKYEWVEFKGRTRDGREVFFYDEFDGLIFGRVGRMACRWEIAGGLNLDGIKGLDLLLPP